MLTFLQFVTEAKNDYGHEYWSSYEDGKNYKGWMSPSGKAHLLPADEEHKDHHHPEYITSGGKQGDPIEHAQRKGFVRFGQCQPGKSMHGDHHFIHYDQKHPQAHRTAIKALDWMKPKHFAPVALSGSAGVFKGVDGNRKRNAKAIKDLGNESVMSPREAYEKLHAGAAKEMAKEKKPIKEETLTELSHNVVSAYRDWGVIHPVSGKLISGLAHPSVRNHTRLKDELIKKNPKDRKHVDDYIEYAQIQSHSRPSEGHLMVRNVHPGNRNTLLKTYDKLPHHQSGEVEFEHRGPDDKDHYIKGNRLRIYNLNREALSKENS